MVGKYYGRKNEVSQKGGHFESKGKRNKGNWFTMFVVKFIFAKTAKTVIAMIVLALLFGSVGFGLQSVFCWITPKIMRKRCLLNLLAMSIILMNTL